MDEGDHIDPTARRAAALLAEGDHIDPFTGARLIHTTPSWYGASQRTQVAAYLVLVAASLDEPASLPSRWAWTEDGYLQVPL
jgi:hypothetical protein